MFTQVELLDLRQAFEAAARPGEEFVNNQSLKALLGSMGIYPNDDMLTDLLMSCGKTTDEDIISFELFARTVALVLEESAEHGSTSSQNEGGDGMSG